MMLGVIHFRRFVNAILGLTKLFWKKHKQRWVSRSLGLPLDHFIKHKPLISEEWVHITHPNTFLYFTTTDGQIFLSCHNQKLMKEKKKTIFFFQTYSLSFFLIFCTIAVYICHSDQKGCHGFCLIARMECKVKFLKSFVWLWTPLCYTTVGSPCKYNKYHKASTLYSLQIRVEFACNAK